MCGRRHLVSTVQTACHGAGQSFTQASNPGGALATVQGAGALRGRGRVLAPLEQWKGIQVNARRQKEL